MSNYDNTNRGGLWKNKNKKSDNHPDFTGKITVSTEYLKAYERDENGNVVIPYAGWKKPGREDGDAWISMQASKPRTEEERQNFSNVGPAPMKTEDNFGF